MKYATLKREERNMENERLNCKNDGIFGRATIAGRISTFSPCCVGGKDLPCLRKKEMVMQSRGRAHDTGCSQSIVVTATEAQEKRSVWKQSRKSQKHYEPESVIAEAAWCRRSVHTQVFSRIGKK